MGICPQHDVLFEKLTALEHLRLFGRFKGVPSAALERDIPIVLEAVKLMDVRNKTAGTYSGEALSEGSRLVTWRLAANVGSSPYSSPCLAAT